MPILTLLRHAPTPWNDQKRIQGRSDISISDRGKALVEAWILPPEVQKARWYCSPLRRARQTADILGIEPEAEQRLIEMSWGEWEGCQLAELRHSHGEAMRRNESRGLDFQPPGGESPRMVQQRIKPWLAEIGQFDGPVAAVTHRGVIRAVTALALEWDMTGKERPKMRPDTARQFEVSNGGRLRLLQPDISLLE